VSEVQVHDTLNELDEICKDAYYFLDAIADVNDRLDVIHKLSVGKPSPQNTGIKGVFSTNGTTTKEKEVTASPEPAPEEMEDEIDHNLDLGEPVRVAHAAVKPASKKPTVCNNHCVIQPHKNTKSTSPDAMHKKAIVGQQTDPYRTQKKTVAETLILHGKGLTVEDLVRYTGIPESRLNDFIFCDLFQYDGKEKVYRMTEKGNQLYRE